MPIGLADVEDPADRRMGDLPRQPHLVEDPLAAVRDGRVDQLQRDRGVEHEVVGAPDVAHAAAADPRDHPVAAGEQLAGLEHVSSRLRRRHGRLVLLVERQQRLDLGAQVRLVGALLVEERGPLVGWAFERLQEHVLGALVQRRHAGGDPARSVLLEAGVLRARLLQRHDVGIGP